MIVVSYASKQLAECCTKFELAQERWGSTDAQALIELIADIEALDNATDLVDFYGDIVMQDEVLSVEFSPNCSARLKPSGRKVAKLADGTIAWDLVRRLIILEIMETAA